MPNDDSARLMTLLSEAKRLAKDYYCLTGRPHEMHCLLRRVRTGSIKE